MSPEHCHRIYILSKRPRLAKKYLRLGPKAGLLRFVVEFTEIALIYEGSPQAYSRWLVPSLVPTIRKLKEARENRSTIIKEFKNRVFAEFDADRAVWLRAIRVLAELDCLFSLANSSTALGEPACRPEFIEGDAASLEFEELRHPALTVRTSSFIPNDVKLGSGGRRVALLTGENLHRQ